MAFLVQWFVKLTGWIPQLLVFRIKVSYEDRHVQDKRIRGKAIVVCNHTALMDFAALMFVFWRRTLRCVVAEVMYTKNFVMSTFLWMLGSIKVDRTSHDFSFLAKSKRILDRGGVVEIYPEARLPKPGEARPLEFKPSAVYLALETGAPIIPVYTNGKMFSREHLHIVIGVPIDVCQMYDESLSQKDNIEHINLYIRGKVIELGQQIEKQAEKEKTEQCFL